MHVCARMCTCVRAYACMRTCVRARACVHACACVCTCVHVRARMCARRDAGTLAALAGGAAPGARLHLPFPQTRARGGPRPERAAERSRAGRGGGGAGVGLEEGGREGGTERASGRRIREVRELFDSRRRSRTGRGGPPGAEGGGCSRAPAARGQDRVPRASPCCSRSSAGCPCSPGCSRPRPRRSSRRSRRVQVRGREEVHPGAGPEGAAAGVYSGMQRRRHLQPGSINEKLPQREGTGKTDDASAPALETQPQGDEEDIASRYPTLWTEQVKSRQNKTNKNSVSSCDQEQQSALEEARQPKNDNVVIPECAHGGLYKPVQCHPSTGYCWCVLVDTGRPIPGTSTRYEQPKCDNTARAHPTRTRDLYKDRPLQGCPGAKKNEFLTSILDALSTDMVHAVSDPSSGRLSEPDPSHTLEERVVHWYFKLLDKNSSGDIGKKEIKPFKRFLRKKSKPKKCVKKFVEYCDVNNDKSISVPELMGCLGVTKEEGKASAKKRPTPRVNAESTSNRQPRKQG
uniref:SPARC related modular calcium binding 2 n=1 Tax=Felis catus TaxID=9685 RepID=A0ABI7Y6L8_FELCA